MEDHASAVGGAADDADEEDPMHALDALEDTTPTKAKASRETTRLNKRKNNTRSACRASHPVQAQTTATRSLSAATLAEEIGKSFGSALIELPGLWSTRWKKCAGWALSTTRHRLIVGIRMLNPQSSTTFLG